MDEIKTKVCSCCGQTLPVTEFYKNRSTKDGYEIYCKKCKRESDHMCNEKRKYMKTQMKELQQENAELRQQLLNATSKTLEECQGRELLSELKRRGYVWQKMTVVQEVDYAKI